MVADPNIRKAFSSVKEDMESLNTRILQLEARLIKLDEKLEYFMEKRVEESPKTPKFDRIESSTPKVDVSTGNEGVQASKQALSKQASTKHPPLNTFELKEELNDRFNSLKKQEFLVFLTIYQLEEDLKKPVTYKDLSSKMGLSESLIRGYVVNLIEKGIPVRKNKVNNVITILTIDPNFRDLGLKQKLTNLFYRQDPDQTSLF